MMFKYCKFCAEQSKLESDFSMLVYYNLLGLEKVPAGHEIEDMEMEKRSEEAVGRVRGWGRAGEWREGEEWMEDVIVGFVKGEKDLASLPHLGSIADGKTARTRKPLARMDNQI
ncbi:hypothetical protein ONZ45_g18980 [Pleurotus djamor]|nr:hypothetical protein ONZ45_g18980 [Pleurotus djamor]